MKYLILFTILFLPFCGLAQYGSGQGSYGTIGAGGGSVTSNSIAAVGTLGNNITGAAATATNAADGTAITNYASAWFYNSTNDYIVDFFNGNDSKPLGGRVYKTLSGIVNKLTANITILAMPGPLYFTNQALTLGDNFHVIGSGFTTCLLWTNTLSIVQGAATYNISLGNNNSFENLTISNVVFQDGNQANTVILPYVGSTIVGPTNIVFYNFVWHNEGQGDICYGPNNNGIGTMKMWNGELFCGFDFLQGGGAVYARNLVMRGNFSNDSQPAGLCHLFENWAYVDAQNVSGYSLGNMQTAAGTVGILNSGNVGSGGFANIIDCNFLFGGTNVSSSYQFNDGSFVISTNSSYYFMCTNLVNVGTNYLPGINSGNGGGLTNLASAFTVVPTNFIGGKFYTNNYGAPIQVSANVVLTTAGVVGYSQLALWVNGQVTNYSSTLSAVAGITGSSTNAIATAFVPSGGWWCFTNSSSGTGDTSVPFGGQILVY